MKVELSKLEQLKEKTNSIMKLYNDLESKFNTDQLEWMKWKQNWLSEKEYYVSIIHQLEGTSDHSFPWIVFTYHRFKQNSRQKLSLLSIKKLKKMRIISLSSYRFFIFWVDIASFPKSLISSKLLAFQPFSVSHRNLLF